MQNDNLVLISGESGSGKSMCLRNLKDPEGVMYLNCEAGKKLPMDLLGAIVGQKTTIKD